MSKTATLAIYSLIGAVARVIIKGDWRWRAFAIGIASVALAMPVAALLVYSLPFYAAAPDIVIHGTYTLSGVVSMSVFERIETAHLSIKLPGGSEIDSKGDDHADRS